MGRGCTTCSWYQGYTDSGEYITDGSYMTGFVYKWTNNTNGKWYIGSHKGTTDDGYVASGIVIKEAMKKYGIDNFTREILYTGNNYMAEEAKLLEALQAKDDMLSYNLTNDTYTSGNNGNRTKSLKGLTYEEILGDERAVELKEIRSKAISGQLNPQFGKPTWNKGKTYTYKELYGEEKADAIKEKKRQSMKKPQRKVECPHCEKIGGITLMKRYHYENCKEIK